MNCKKVVMRLFWRLFDPDKNKELRPEFIKELKRREAAHDKRLMQ